MDTTTQFIFLILLGGFVSGSESVVYHVLPTKPIDSCPGNGSSSCPLDQHCLKMDYLVEHSSKLFSSDHVTVTLVFMCGVHNYYTKDWTVQNLTSFVVKGAAKSRENVIIDHQFGTQPKCTIIQFFNISLVNITNLTMRCPAIKVKESHISVKSSTIFGYPSIKDSLSFIHITGRGSLAVLDNCKFSENCFIASNLSDGLIVSNSTFQAYRHESMSIIMAYSSDVTLTGSVNFTDSVKGFHSASISFSGTAIFLRTTQPNLEASLTISTGANVYFVNLKCDNFGGAVYGDTAIIHIDAKSRVVFIHNSEGAIYLYNGTIFVRANSIVEFTYNFGHKTDGGGIFLLIGVIQIDSNASLTFSHNSADLNGGALRLSNGELIVKPGANLIFNNNSATLGGAIYLINATIHVDTDNVYFYGNRGTQGGALYFIYGKILICSNRTIMFIENAAHTQGGAIYVESDIDSTVVADNFSRLVFLNNSAFQGGALSVVPSSFTVEVRYHSSIQFINNTAHDVGGAVYADAQPAAPCLFMVTDYSADISFIGNHANSGIGHHMYGTSIRSDKCDRWHTTLVNAQGLPYCRLNREKSQNLKHVGMYFVDPGLNETLSTVSSAPQRVCLCDSNGQPQCAKMSQIFTNISVYRGETFRVSAYVVGYNFGTTVGIVHAGFLDNSKLSQLGQLQYNQLVNSSETCINLEYTVFTRHEREMLQLQTSVLPVSVYTNQVANGTKLSQYKKMMKDQITDFFSHDNGCLDGELLRTPVFINITLLPGCPPGLTLIHDHSTMSCSCYFVLASNDFKCSIENKTGLLQWNSTMWVNATYNSKSYNSIAGIVYNKYCPLFYCKSGSKIVNIGDDPSKQCASNRTGILCGACVDSFSLAIGSSRCIECPSSHNVALLLAFAAAGVLLVFFILALNLTVTQGLINGVIFYANIVWAYKIVLLPLERKKNYWLVFLQIFLAWLNLDFGIESCFFVGLNAYWKTWLQFLFPFYIWGIAGVIIIACRYSSRLTNLIGSRAVPLLATLFLLSYMKLLRTVIDATSVAVIAQYPQNTSYAVWYLDGNLRYCQQPHIYLFIAAIATLVFLWLPYTLLLLFIQPLRRVSHLRPLKWINKLAPIYDAHFAPLKGKHHYWFGAMLLVRGVLLVLLTVTSVANPELNVFVVFLFTAFLLFLTSVKDVYKQTNVRFLESTTLLNLLTLSAGMLYKWEFSDQKIILLQVSIGITFAQFCVIVVCSLFPQCFRAGLKYCRHSKTYDVTITENTDDNIAHERIEDPELESLISYRILH